MIKSLFYLVHNFYHSTLHCSEKDAQKFWTEEVVDFCVKTKELSDVFSIYLKRVWAQTDKLIGSV